MEGSYSRRKTTASAYYSQVRVDASETFTRPERKARPWYGLQPRRGRTSCRTEAAGNGQPASEAVASRGEAVADPAGAWFVANADARADVTRGDDALRPHLGIRARQTRADVDDAARLRARR